LFTVQTSKNEREWLVQMLEKFSVSNSRIYTFQVIKSDFKIYIEDFELFWYSKPGNTLREFGLLVFLFFYENYINLAKIFRISSTKTFSLTNFAP